MRYRKCTVTFLLVITLYVPVKFIIEGLQVVSDSNIKKYVYTEDVISTPTCTKEQKNFVFIKVMKCATESLGPMFRKFGYDRNLTYVLPVEDRIWIGWPFPFNKYDYRPSRKPYNILIEHSIYNQSMLQQLMPRDTIYISSIRHPLSRLKSSFNYFNTPKQCNLTNKTDPVNEYLNNVQNIPQYFCTGLVKTWRRFCPPVKFSQMHNEMAHSLGMPLGFPLGRKDITENLEAVKDYIRGLGENFHLIMIVEYFHESLILLKRLMCWSFKDLFYVSRNVGYYSYKHSKVNTKNTEFFEKWNEIDYLLYNHFNKTLWTNIQQQSADFFDEVATFNQFQKEGEAYCTNKIYGKRKDELPEYIVFNKTIWNPLMNITKDNCLFYFSDILKKLKDIYDVHERMYHTKPDIKTCRI